METSEKARIRELVDYLTEISASRIGIDGLLHVGKTTLARELASHLQFGYVGLDDFLEPDQGHFVDFLDYDSLAISLQQTPLVVEGIRLLAALRLASVQPDVVVYVRPGPSYWQSICRGNLLCEAAIYLHSHRPDSVADFAYTPPHSQVVDRCE